MDSEKDLVIIEGGVLDKDVIESLKRALSPKGWKVVVPEDYGQLFPRLFHQAKGDPCVVLMGDQLNRSALKGLPKTLLSGTFFNGREVLHWMRSLGGAFWPVIVVSTEHLWNEALFGQGERVQCLHRISYIKAPFDIHDFYAVLVRAGGTLERIKKDEERGSPDFERTGTCLARNVHQHGINEDEPTKEKGGEITRFWDRMKNGHGPLRVLVIEDKYAHIESALQVVADSTGGAIEFVRYCRESGKEQPPDCDACEHISSCFTPQSVAEHMEADYRNGDGGYDFVLLDLLLGEDKAGSGQYGRSRAILERLNRRERQAPVFILTWESRLQKVTEMVRTFRADNFVHKSRVKDIPERIAQYFLEETGKLVTLLPARYRRNLVGNIRYWKQNRELLWSGNKCYLMVDHSFTHTENIWWIANDILPAIIERHEKEITPEDLYALYMAIWLHDIGHKGNERYGEPHEVRELHSLISAEIILKHPEHYGIFGYEKEDCSPYRWVSFRHPKTAPQLIRERIATLAGQETSAEGRPAWILEKIALFCLYHSKRFPIDQKEAVRKKRLFPVDSYEFCDRETDPIHLKSISDLTASDTLLKLATVLRFIDGIDIRQNRVGDDNTEESIKRCNKERDVKQLFLKLALEVERLRDAYLKGGGKERRFVKLFYDEVRDQLETKYTITAELKTDRKRFVDGLDVDMPLDNYQMLLGYIVFVSGQDGHFKLHNAFHQIRIKPLTREEGKVLGFEIVYVSDKDIYYLADLREDEEIAIRDFEKGTKKSILGYLLGRQEEDTEWLKWPNESFQRKDTKNGLVRQELKSGKDYIEDWISLADTRIGISLSGTAGDGKEKELKAGEGEDRTIWDRNPREDESLPGP